MTSQDDWDPMREDYNDTCYDAQYPDDESTNSPFVALDHKKLYVTNIPAGLNENGLKTAFEKYGQVDKIFLSRDPQKRYALVSYDTAAEARIAMMKLNRTEPLELSITLAHAKYNPPQFKGKKEFTKKAPSVVASYKERNSRNHDDSSLCDDEMLDDSVGFDQNIHLELEKIKLEKLRIQEEKLKSQEKIMLLQMKKRPVNQTPAESSSRRRLLPDGRVVMVQERVQEPDASFTAGAGDSLNIPGLQRGGDPSCIVCGVSADFFCARCTVTPYCSLRCQREDWPGRHSSVCHNLMRLNASRNKPPADGDNNLNNVRLNASRNKPPADGDNNLNNVSVPTPPQPLRRPRSPGASQNEAPRNGVANNNNNKAKYLPSGHNPPMQRAPQNDLKRPPRGNMNQQRRQDSNENGEWDNKAQEKPPSPLKAPPRQAFEKPKSKFDIPKTKTDIQNSNFDNQKPKFDNQMSMSNTPKSKTEVPKAEEVAPVKSMGVTVTSETRVKSKAPEMPLVPAQYLVEKLPIGEAFILSVEKQASSCGTKQAGFVCLAMHADCEEQYTMLLGDIFDGESAIVPQPGTTFAYFNPEDEGWYRARCLNAKQCALIDASRLADITAGQCRQLGTKFANIPEFCCVLNGKVKVGMSIKCTILMKSGVEYKVSLDADDAYLGEGSVTRWLPEVETPAPKPKEHPLVNRFSRSPIMKSQPSETKQEIPEPRMPPLERKVQQAPENIQKPQEVPRVQNKVQEASKPKVTAPKLSTIDRPDIVNNGRYVLLHVTSPSHVCVRSSDDETTREFESVLQDVALYGIQNGKRLTEPPVAGHVVLCHYEGVHYRALVVRTKAADNKFKVQYAEYGNEEIVTLDKLFACPRELDLAARPSRASIVSLSRAVKEITEEAAEYLDSLKEEVELVATIPTGEKTVPSGSLIQLSIAKNKENINNKLEEMCTPDWKKLEVAGGDVIDSDVFLIGDIKTLPLPTDRPFKLCVTDVSSIKCGIISGYEVGATLAPFVYGPLTDKINEYCNSSLCKEPYLPAVEEICLARMDGYPQWFRAVVLSHLAGASTASILYLDYGRIASDVPVASLRKCMREFIARPALAALILIQDWPETATDEQVIRALEYLKLDEDGNGTLHVNKCVDTEDDSYTIVHPGIIAAINAV